MTDIRSTPTIDNKEITNIATAAAAGAVVGAAGYVLYSRYGDQIGSIANTVLNAVLNYAKELQGSTGGNTPTPPIVR